MRKNIAVSTVAIFVLLVLGLAFVWAQSGSAKPSPVTGNLPGRYLIAVAAQDALLVDTVTGCVWHSFVGSIPFPSAGGGVSSIRMPVSFKLANVPGLVDLPASKETEESAPGTAQTFSERCRR